MEKKVIQYIVRESYGNSLEYIANPADARLVELLTGRKTINSVIRELIRDLSGGRIQFEEVWYRHANN
jgi:hypothetical protein